jgi:exosortase
METLMGVSPCQPDTRPCRAAPRLRWPGLPNWLGPAVLGAALAWAYWPVLVGLVRKWSQDPQYSHGYLVPVFSLVLLGIRRQHWARVSLTTNWWGLALIGAAGGLRLASAYVYFGWLDAVSFLVALAGLVILLGGMAAWRWSWPALSYLLFMLPLPFQLEVALAHPLQRVATQASTYCLQLLGLPALAEGNIIIMDDLKIGVLEACNGLGMLLTFFALSTAVAVVIRRPWIDRVVLVASAVPIALAMNIVRITATGVLHRTVGSAIANAVFHDLAGWLMMPAALGLLWLELLLFDHLLLRPEATGPVPLWFGRSRRWRSSRAEAPAMPLVPDPSPTEAPIAT